MDDSIIRLGATQDIDRIYEIEKNTFVDTPWTYEMVFGELLKNPDKQTWVIEIKNQILGYYMVRFGPDEVHLINITVDPNHQMKGIGKKLMNHLLESIPAHSSVFLEVKRGNFPAINLYLNAGFKEILIREKYYSDGSDAIVMCLNK